MERDGADARRAGALADRERNVQHVEEPGLRVRAQLRPRQEASGDGVRGADAAGVLGIDQLQKARCSLFQVALARKGRAKYFWEDFRSMFKTYRLPDWETYYRALAFGHRVPVPVPLDTS